MAHYLITGRSATGKTTLWRELLVRGLDAYDGDKVPGLAGWTDVSTGLRITDGYPGDDHPGKFTWDWDEKTLHTILQSENDIYICGNADNALDFYSLFDKVFVLDLPPETQRARILKRTEHDYGKDPTIQEDIISGQKILLNVAQSKGAVVVDASRKPSKIIDEILSYTS